MMGKTHVVLGVTAGALTAAAVSPYVAPGVALLCIPIGAAAGPGPDVDHHAAPARSVGIVALIALALWWHPAVYLYAVPVVWLTVSRILGWFGVPMSRPERAWRTFWRHRGGTHRIRTAVAVGAVIAAVTWYLGNPWLHTNGWVVGLAVTAGWLSHIYGDGRTHSGIPIFDGEWTIGRTVRTGSTYASARRLGEDPLRTEQHLRQRRFVPTAWASSAGALLIVTGAWIPVAAALAPLWDAAAAQFTR